MTRPVDYDEAFRQFAEKLDEQYAETPEQFIRPRDGRDAPAAIAAQETIDDADHRARWSDVDVATMREEWHVESAAWLERESELRDAAERDADALAEALQPFRKWAECVPHGFEGNYGLACDADDLRKVLTVLAAHAARKAAK